MAPKKDRTFEEVGQIPEHIVSDVAKALGEEDLSAATNPEEVMGWTRTPDYYVLAATIRATLDTSEKLGTYTPAVAKQIVDDTLFINRIIHGESPLRERPDLLASLPSNIPLKQGKQVKLG